MHCLVLLSQHSNLQFLTISENVQDWNALIIIPWPKSFGVMDFCPSGPFHDLLVSAFV
jgi:hypothetical protein